MNFGLRKDPYEPSKDRKLSAPKVNLPRSVSWESQMSPIKNQGKLGSCVGFATVALKEWQEQIENIDRIASGKKVNKNDNYYDLSEAWVYWKAKAIDIWPNEEGTSIKYAMEVLHKIGVPTEEYWTYSDKDKDKGEAKDGSDVIAKLYRIESYERVETIDDMRAALVRGPIVAGVSLFDEISRPGPDGYVPYPKREKYFMGGHAICIVGYDDGKERIRFKNSWGTGWGQRGYGEFDYKYIRDFLWDAWSAVDMKLI